MNFIRIALANLRFPATPDEAITLAEQAVEGAAAGGARIVCFPECFVPGYRIGKTVPVPDQAFLERAWSRVGAAAAKGNITVVLGTERIVDGAHRISALVINPDGSIAGFQDKVQLDPSEEATFAAGVGRSSHPTKCPPKKLSGDWFSSTNTSRTIRQLAISRLESGNEPPFPV